MGPVQATFSTVGAARMRTFAGFMCRGSNTGAFAESLAAACSFLGLGSGPAAPNGVILALMAVPEPSHRHPPKWWAQW